MYDFKIKWCPVCNQGWIQIVKEKASGKLFLYCEECETEWENPEEVSVDNGTQDVYGFIEQPAEKDIEKCGWNKYLV